MLNEHYLNSEEATGGGGLQIPRPRIRKVSLTSLIERLKPPSKASSEEMPGDSSCHLLSSSSKPTTTNWFWRL